MPGDFSHPTANYRRGMPIVDVTCGHLDPPGIDLLIEVRSKWFASREENRQDRCDRLCQAVIAVIRRFVCGLPACFLRWASDESGL